VGLGHSEGKSQKAGDTAKNTDHIDFLPHTLQWHQRYDRVSIQLTWLCVHQKQYPKRVCMQHGRVTQNEYS